MSDFGGFPRLFGLCPKVPFPPDLAPSSLLCPSLCRYVRIYADIAGKFWGIISGFARYVRNDRVKMSAFVWNFGYVRFAHLYSPQFGHFERRINPDISSYVERHAAKRADISEISGQNGQAVPGLCPYNGANSEGLDFCHKSDICHKILPRNVLLWLMIFYDKSDISDMSKWQNDMSDMSVCNYKTTNGVNRTLARSCPLYREMSDMSVLPVMSFCNYKTTNRTNRVLGQNGQNGLL